MKENAGKPVNVSAEMSSKLEDDILESAVGGGDEEPHWDHLTRTEIELLVTMKILIAERDHGLTTDLKSREAMLNNYKDHLVDRNKINKYGLKIYWEQG